MAWNVAYYLLRSGQLDGMAANQLKGSVMNESKQAPKMNTMEQIARDMREGTFPVKSKANVSVELLNIERSVTDDLRTQNAKLRSSAPQGDGMREALERAVAGTDHSPIDKTDEN